MILASTSSPLGECPLTHERKLAQIRLEPLIGENVLVKHIVLPELLTLKPGGVDYSDVSWQEIVAIAKAQCTSTIAAAMPWEWNGCVDFVWGVANRAGANYYNPYLSNGETFEGRVVYNSAEYSSGRAVPPSEPIFGELFGMNIWHTEKYGSDYEKFIKNLLPGDIVRINGVNGPHSFIVTEVPVIGNSTPSQIMIVDNYHHFGPKTDLAYISEHPLQELFNTFFPSGVFSKSYVSRLMEHTPYLTGNKYADILRGSDAAEVMAGNDGDDYIYAGGGNDEIIGGYGSERQSGGAGDDTLDGFFGLDVLYGGTGNDILVGGGDQDTLFGGSGNDTMMGGTGDDRFVFARFSGRDRITDFVAGPSTFDAIDLSARHLSLLDLTFTPVNLGFSTRISIVGSSESILLVGVAFGSLSMSDDLIL